jgi:site-specific DNA-methyltransferase (adenine-specific)/site-specific DNA-methyltransferase (cytosine-N4-specific)
MRAMSSQTLICGNCQEKLAEYPDDYFDLVVTSPPYSDQRKDTYGGPTADNYVEWFLPISAQIYRTLKPTGTFVLNIKEKVVKCERHTYVLELILALRKQGWLWTEEFIWSKKNCSPGKWPNRFRDAWERCLQFNKSKKFAMYQDAVKVPVKDWAKSRLKNLSEKDLQRQDAQTQSGFGKNISNWVGRDMVYPSNVLHLATECGNKGHSAVFPRELPEFFIKLFTKEGDRVLDPFVGSGTVLSVCRSLNREGFGIEIRPDYCEQIRQRLDEGR